MATMLPLLLLLAGLMPRPTPPLTPPSTPSAAPNGSAAAAPPSPASSPPIRGRDPWVFRCIFEDRSRMVIIAPAKDAWIAFNPNTCAIQKVWLGGMEFRGKVWDFSQDNCKAADNAEVLLEQPSTIADLPDQPGEPTGGWQADGVRFESAAKGWAFSTDHATLASGTIDLSAWDNVFITFEERGRPQPIRFEFSADDGATWQAQVFDSTTHGSSASDWQRNLKQVSVRSPKTRLRISQEHAADAKGLRDLRIFGDQQSWTLTRSEGTQATTEVLTPRWKGYELLKGTEGLALNFDLAAANGTITHLRQQIDLRTDAGGGIQLQNALTVSGLSDGHALTGPGVKSIRADGAVDATIVLRKGNQ